MGSAVIWKEFPEVNLKCAFSSHYSSNAGVLGCHCGTITNVGVNTGEHSAGYGQRWIEFIEGKEKLNYSKVRVYGNSEPDTKVVELLFKHLNEKVSFNSFREEFFKLIVEGTKSAPIWVISDAVNRGAAARMEKRETIPNASLDEGMLSYKLIAQTMDFVDWLIETKQGYMMESPVVQNPLHRVAGNYSLNQVFVWIHPEHLNRSLYTAQEHGWDKFPTKEQWAETLSKDFNAGVLSKTLIAPAGQSKLVQIDATGPSKDAIFDYMFRPGQFDRKDSRFIHKAREA